jgi:hypothetical protein
MYAFDIYKNEIAYFRNTKCGSRTILGWAAILKYPNILNEHPEWFTSSRQYVEYKEIRKLIPKYDDPPPINQKIRFTIVRDPIERFISAYTNRILFHKQPDVSYLGIDYFIDNIQELMNKPEYKNARIHFYSQAYDIGHNPEIYTHIFKFKDIDMVKKMIEQYTGTILPNIHLQQSKGVEKIILDINQISKLKKIYQIDYDIYGKYI